MRRDVEIVREMLHASIQKDRNYANSIKKELEKVSFWETLTDLLAKYKESPSSILAEFYKLKLSSAEQLYDELPTIYSKFVVELADSYANGQPSPSAEYLIKCNNPEFLEALDYSADFMAAIKIAERENLKKKLTLSIEGEKFNLDESEITAAVKIAARRDLKSKMKDWDQKIEENHTHIQPFPLRSIKTRHGLMDMDMKQNSRFKAKSLTWVKYAIAACFIGIVVWFGIDQYKHSGTNHYAKQKEDNSQKRLKSQSTKLTDLSTPDSTVINTKIFQEDALGFVGRTPEKITIVLIDLDKQIKQLKKSRNRSDVTSEIDSLQELRGKYIFDHRTLTIYEKNIVKPFVLSSADSDYFIKLNGSYFRLKKTAKAQKMQVLQDSAAIQDLERIIFLNE